MDLTGSAASAHEHGGQCPSSPSRFVRTAGAPPAIATPLTGRGSAGFPKLASAKDSPPTLVTFRPPTPPSPVPQETLQR